MPNGKIKFNGPALLKVESDPIMDSIKNKESTCEHCNFLHDLLFDDVRATEREYFLMTEVFVYLHDGDVCKFSVGGDLMYELTGIDAEIFIENLNRELTDEERSEVRKWAGIE